ncbi:MAG: hypothetical protein IJT21_10115 [Synergistaceae bacterium]|nr:hypothetical protein [Synergistaceae bacterium]
MPNLASKEAAARLLNITERRLEQLAHKKIIPKVGRGVFDLAPTVNAYVRYLQGLCAGRINDEPSELDKRLMEAKVLERESKARQAKCRADSMEQSFREKNLLEKLIIRLRSRIQDRGIIAIIEDEISALTGGDN